MRSHLAATGLLFTLFVALAAVDAALTAWWDSLPEDSMLPFFAAAAIVFAPLFLVRRGRRLVFDSAWADEHIVASSAIYAVGLFVFALAWGAIAREPWPRNVGQAAAAAGVMLVTLNGLGYAVRYAKRREASRRGIGGPRANRAARRVGRGVVIAATLFLLLGLIVEISDAL